MKEAARGFTIRMIEAAEPENLIWENLGLDFSERVVRVLVSWFLTCVFLTAGFALIFYAQQEQEKLADSYPTLDCTPYQVNPFYNSSAYTWSNGTKVYSTVGSNVLTPQTIVEDLRPSYYNLTEQNTGLLGCFCYALLDKSATGCKEPEHSGECNLNFKFEDENGVDHTYCQKWVNQLRTVYLWSYGAVAGIVAINVMLKEILRKLVNLEVQSFYLFFFENFSRNLPLVFFCRSTKDTIYNIFYVFLTYYLIFSFVLLSLELNNSSYQYKAPESETQRIVSLTVKLFIALLVNTAIITLLIKGSISDLTGGSTFLDSMFRKMEVLQVKKNLLS